MSKHTDETQEGWTAPEPDAPAAETTPTPTAPPLKPHVVYGAQSVELHLVPGGRAIIVGPKTKAVKLPRDPSLELDDPNVRLVLAMAAGPDFVAAGTDSDLHAKAHAKARGEV